jgi:hypothetical protein
MTTLRRELAAQARTLLPALMPEVRTIMASLSANGMSHSAYSVVFSYVLDGLVWQQFGDAADVRAQIDAEHPFWNGAFWAVSPKRGNAPGTNSYRVDDSTRVLMTWTDSTLALLRPLQDKAALTSFVSRGGLLVLDERRDTPLMRSSRAMAHDVADAMRAWVSHADLEKLEDTRDPRLGLLIAYHEFMWELLDALVADGVLQPPALLAPPVPSTRDVAPLIIVLRH